jgi:hypothetical protein
MMMMKTTTMRTPLAATPRQRPPQPVEDRAWQYISRMPPSVQGEGGSAALFRVAVVLVRGFNLPPDAASPLLEHWNRAFSRPVWTEAELRHKLRDADRSGHMPYGHLLQEDESGGATGFRPLYRSSLPPRTRAAEPPAVNPAEQRARHTFFPLTDADEARIAALRHVTPGMVHLFKNKGLLHNTRVDGQTCWCLVEDTFAQARRYDGGLLRTARGPTKARTLAGSRGSFFGRSFLSRGRPPVLMVEGVVGLLEAASAIDLADAPWVPLAAVTAGATFTRDPKLLELLRGRRVRILPDEGEAGRNGAATWHAELTVAGAQVDVIVLPAIRNDLAHLLADPRAHAQSLHLLFAD